MEYRKLGNSDVAVSAIAFGAWAIGGWMWGGADRNDAIEALHEAYDLGMTSIDTAAVYGFGLSEEIVGEAIKGKRDKVQIFTKYGLSWNTPNGQFFFESQDAEGKPVKIHRHATKQRVLEECEESLRRLNTDYIDLYQIHWADPGTPISETMEAIDILLKQGKIRAAGVCNYTSDQMKEAEKIVNLVSNQVPYSMVVRGIEQELVPYCVANGKSILPYSPLQRGLLTGKITNNYKFNEGDTRATNVYFQSPNLDRINAFLLAIKPIADSRQITLSQLVLNWTLNRPGVSCVLAGARTPAQVSENVVAANFKLTNDELEVINTNLDKLVIEK